MHKCQTLDNPPYFKPRRCYSSSLEQTHTPLSSIIAYSFTESLRVFCLSKYFTCTTETDVSSSIHCQTETKYIPWLYHLHWITSSPSEFSLQLHLSTSISNICFFPLLNGVDFYLFADELYNSFFSFF